jgi:lipoate-protein ligase A
MLANAALDKIMHVSAYIHFCHHFLYDIAIYTSANCGKEAVARLKTTPWRLIETTPLSGTENMAIDEALLACFNPVESAPILRLYGWNPPAFSCGRFQKPAEIIDLNRCQADGVQVVQRITGGGVIYHAAELTYSLVCPADFIPGSRGVKDAFFQLTSFLLQFYRKLDLDACHAVDWYSGDKRFGVRTPLCFAGIESCDILIDGRKIGGNAQRRLKNVIFQHGSIPIKQMAAAGNSYLLQPDDGIIERTTALTDQEVSAGRGALAELLAASFCESFGVACFPDQLTAAERSCTAEYMQKPNDFSSWIR